MRRQRWERTGPESGREHTRRQDPSEREKSPAPHAREGKPAQLPDDAWDVFADDAEALPEPEYGDFWLDPAENDEV